ncbi:ribosome hibernation-promoting factor, HPF/YfiA family [Salinivirga cyanobacteriivorans]|uniref:Ribosome hibernation promoting factor n=1 Tax=Salinivirga cyanobacteriivorans TaxID=1307839 RepID=A0A0S2HXJ6_9BACT|nr:ribosome-associated translation inhibitor RaiA [Salinivirga cyanobacteriivorans]ALO14775.1 Ribosome hibernation promoting factor [Salinivirga cyanobacteriivorans]
MDVKIHSIKFDADQKLIQFIESKISKLEQVFDNIIEVEVFLRLSKNQNTENKLVEMKISIPGNELFAKKQCKTFEEATDQSVEALRRQIKKHKEKVRGI